MSTFFSFVVFCRIYWMLCFLLLFSSGFIECFVFFCCFLLDLLSALFYFVVFCRIYWVLCFLLLFSAGYMECFVFFCCFLLEKFTDIYLNHFLKKIWINLLLSGQSHKIFKHLFQISNLIKFAPNNRIWNQLPGSWSGLQIFGLGKCTGWHKW